MVTTQIAAVVLMFVVHVVGGVVLVRAMFGGERPDLWGWWPGDGREQPPPPPPAPADTAASGGGKGGGANYEKMFDGAVFNFGAGSDGKAAAEDSSSQMAVARAASELKGIRLTFRQAYDEMMEAAERGEPISIDKRVAWRW